VGDPKLSRKRVNNRIQAKIVGVLCKYVNFYTYTFTHTLIGIALDATPGQVPLDSGTVVFLGNDGINLERVE